MKVGDLVVTYTKNIGIVLRKHEKAGTFGLTIYIVFLNNQIKQFTEAGVREINEY